MPWGGIFSRLAAAVVFAEGWWFDVRHNVCTRTGKQDSLGHDANAGFWYLPTRPGTARSIFHELPVSNYSNYTFVDFGSGKGRMMLLAAEFPFSAVQGVEYNRHLHECAKKNLENRRNFNIRAGKIEAVNLSAADYEFPATNLVLYFFNPFGPELMEKILERLEHSLEQVPRDAIVAMLYSDYNCEKESSWLKLHRKTGLCRVYRAEAKERSAQSLPARSQ